MKEKPPPLPRGNALQRLPYQNPTIRQMSKFIWVPKILNPRELLSF